jgi:hypothetical protein
MVNAENILKVADAIETHSIPDLGFNLTFYMSDIGQDEYDTDLIIVDRSGHNCGTVACIAGWSAALRTGSALDASVMSEALYLGLDYSSGAKLFGCDMPINERNVVTQEQAVRTLRHLAATGEVDWTV